MSDIISTLRAANQDLRPKRESRVSTKSRRCVMREEPRVTRGPDATVQSPTHLSALPVAAEVRSPSTRCVASGSPAAHNAKNLLVIAAH
jgi:hypothetical protein